MQKDNQNSNSSRVMVDPASAQRVPETHLHQSRLAVTVAMAGKVLSKEQHGSQS